MKESHPLNTLEAGEMLKQCGELFIGFFRAGMLGYGGGPSSIPLFHKEAVERFRWMSDEEFGDVLAIANTLPGPIATKLAGYIGYRIAGIFGMLSALAATVVPTVLIMGVLLGYLSTIQEAAWVAGMTTAIQPVIGVMLFVLAYDFLKKSWKGQGKGLTVFLGLLSVVTLQFAGVHPGLLIGALLLCALLVPDKKKSEHEQKEKEAVGK